jgi:WD40 repeat protein/tRNA A-37 threonylcarbamoyl transferase component Bud32
MDESPQSAASRRGSPNAGPEADETQWSRAGAAPRAGDATATLTPEVQRWLDAACDRFEAAWKAGPRPRPEDYLGDPADPRRSILLRELVALDVAYRRRHGEQPAAQDYRDRFPEFDSRWLSLTSPAAPGGVAAAVQPPGYEVVGELGRGGMGVVYLAWQVRLKRLVALKMLRDGALADAEALARFRAEAEAVGRLQHPNIVQVHEVGEHDGRPFLVLEYVAGGSLAQRLDGTPWAARPAAALVEALARAIDAAHRQGIVHRDLKPANILLVSGGLVRGEGSSATTHASPLTIHQPKITDFGLAKFLVGGSEQTQSGQVMGTASYMAPEQAGGQTRLVGPPTDVYALGAVLYELLTGRPPFRGETVMETLQQVSAGNPVPISRLQPRVPRDVETICLKCLEREPHRRYPGALELAEDLQRFLAGLPVRARPIGPVGRLGRWCRRNPALAGSIGMAAAALLAAAGVSLVFGLSEHQAAIALEATLQQTKRDAARLQWDRGRGLCEQGQVGQGLLVLARVLQMLPADDSLLQPALRLDLADFARQLHSLRAVFPHGAAVHALALSQDGTVAVSGGADGIARLWEVGTGRALRPLAGHEGAVLAVAFRPDGKAVLTGGADRTARLWEVETGRLLCMLRGHDGAVTGVAFRPDGQAALTGSADATARLWHLPGGAFDKLVRHPGPVAAVAWSPDGKLLMTGGSSAADGKGEVRLWGAATGTESGSPLRVDLPIRAVAFSPDGQTVLTGDDNRDVTLWDLAGGDPIAQLEHQGKVLGIALSSDGQAVLATSDGDHAAHLWNLRDRAEWKSLGRALRAGKLGTCVKWDRPLDPPLPHPKKVTAVAFGPDGRALLTGGADGTVRLWQRAPGKLPERDWAHELPVLGAAISPDGRWVLTGECHKFNPDVGAARLRPVEGPDAGIVLPHPNKVRAVAFSPDSKTALTACDDGRVRFWDVPTGAARGAALVQAGPLLDLAVSRDGRFILTGTGDGTAHLWDATTRKEVVPPLRHPDGQAVYAVAFGADGPDGLRLLTIGAGVTARLWLWDGGAGPPRPGPVLWHPPKVNRAVFSPDGNTVLTCGADKVARLWDPESGNQLVLEFRLEHQHAVLAAAFSPNGELILTGSDDGAQLWEAHTGRRLGLPCRHPGITFPAQQLFRPPASTYRDHDSICAVAFGPDGRKFLIGSWYSRSSLWAVPVGLPPEVDAAEVALWAQVRTGMRLEDSGSYQVLDADAWRESMQKLRQQSVLALP